MFPILIVALSQIAAADINVPIPAKILSDHSKIEQISAGDMAYIVSQAINFKCSFLFFDRLQSIDKVTAVALRENMNVRGGMQSGCGVLLGVPSIDDDTLKELLALRHETDQNPFIECLFFTRLKRISNEQVEVLLKWRGHELGFPERIEMTSEAKRLISTRFHTWRFSKFSADDIPQLKRDAFKIMENIYSFSD